MNFSWSKIKNAGRTSKKSPEELISWFEAEIKREDDIVFGTTLFLEGVRILCAGQDGVIETYRKQLRNVMQTAKDSSKEATALLEQARQDTNKLPSLEKFNFAFRDASSESEDAIKRAETLMIAYRKLFPGRERTQTCSEEEILQLVEEASEQFAGTKQV